jgi:hypothetical protein
MLPSFSLFCSYRLMRAPVIRLTNRGIDLSGVYQSSYAPSLFIVRRQRTLRHGYEI